MVDLLECIRTNMDYLLVATPECKAESDTIVAYLRMFGERWRPEVLSKQSVDIRALVDGTPAALPLPCVFRKQQPIGGLSNLRALFAREQRMDIG